jgi:3-hydroxyacyl-[acyl-carrier-protein] dehydratase
MSLNGFFEIKSINTTADKLTAILELNADHVIYAAHFPGNPITPGVVEIELVKKVLESHLGHTLQLVSIARCNFLKILNPIDTPVITLNITTTTADGMLKVNAAAMHNETTFYKLSAVYK